MAQTQQQKNSPPPLDEIYRQLQRGAGHEWVTDDNVATLIGMASAKGHHLIEVELREWRNPCAPSSEDQAALTALSNSGGLPH